MSKVRKSGWVILHPSGFMELDYFNAALIDNKYDRIKPLTPKQWMRRYRPDCTLHRVTIEIVRAMKGSQ